MSVFLFKARLESCYQTSRDWSLARAENFDNRRNDPSYWAIRGREQLMIQYFRSMNMSGNAINGISPNNSNLNLYLNAAKNLIKNPFNMR